MPPSKPPAPGVISLIHIAPGHTAKVMRLRGSDTFQARLRNLGLREGLIIEVIKQAPLADPREYRLGPVHLSLRREEAERIDVIAIDYTPRRGGRRRRAWRWR